MSPLTSTQNPCRSRSSTMESPLWNTAWAQRIRQEKNGSFHQCPMLSSRLSVKDKDKYIQYILGYVNISHPRSMLWYIYLHVPSKSTKCRELFHTWILWYMYYVYICIYLKNLFCDLGLVNPHYFSCCFVRWQHFVIPGPICTNTNWSQGIIFDFCLDV